MMRHFLAALAAASVVIGASSAARAQTAFRFADPVGRNVTRRFTPLLTPGWYEIQTTSLSSGTDTVLSVFQLGAAQAFAGSDGCPGNPLPSCVRVQVTTSTNLEIIVRAWDIPTFGTGNLRIQRTTDGTETTYAPSVCPGGTTSVTDTCWYTWTGLTFGGFVAPLGAATNLHVETRQLPGATTNVVELWTTGDNSDPANNWRMRYIGGDHRSLVVATREFIGPFPAGAQTIVAGPANGPNPFELLRNDYGRFGSTTFGTDADGDGLGSSLEHNWLFTCDSTAGPTHAGLTCASLVGCASPSSALCLASLRDTDRDGYEDALELYGFQSGSTFSLSPTNLARFGADPARYDVFVEVDVGNQRLSAPSPACDYTGSAYVDYREATQIARTYRTATMAAFPNRYGTPGIQLHLDIPPPGPLVRSDVAPPLNDPNVGTWGGATCYRGPECTTNSQCNFGTDTTGVCDPNTAATPRYCVTYDGLAHGMVPERRWLFRRVLAFGDVIPTATQVYAFGPGGGQTPPYLQYGAPLSAVYHVTASVGFPGALAHELGHHAGLDHSGPTLSHVLSGFDQGFAPLRYSQMNYGYSGFGFVETPAVVSLPANQLNTVTVPGVPLGALPVLNFTDLDRVSFASGAASLDPLAAPETAVTPAPFDVVPFNSSVPLAPPNTADWLGAPRWTMTAGRDVNWDGRSGTLGAGLTEEAPLYLFETRVRRQPAATPSRWTLLYTPTRFVVRGTRSWLFRATRSTTSGGPVMTLSENDGAVPCANAPATSGPRFLQCDFAPGGEVPVFLSPQLNTLDPLSFSAAPSAGTSIGGAMLVWVDRTTGTLRWGLAQPGQGGALSPHGTIAGAPTTTFDGSHVISLARMGGSQNLSLVYRSGTSLRETVLTWSGNTPSWSASTVIPGLTAVAARSSAGLATSEGYAGVSDGLVMAFRSDSTLETQIWRRGTSTTPATGWTFVGNAGIPTGNQLWGAPQLDFSRVRRGTAQDWFLNLTVATGNDSRYRRSDTNSLVFPTAGGEGIADFDQNTDRRDLFPTSVTWDPRTAAGAFRGLRGVSSTWSAPGSCATTPCPTGQTCTAVGARRLCMAADGFPPGGVNCSSADSCPAGMACSPTVSATVGVCTRTGYVRAEERRHPGSDGLVPGRVDVLDDWRMLRQGFCLGMRLQRVMAPVGANIPGTTIPYSAPTPSGPEVTCAFATY